MTRRELRALVDCQGNTMSFYPVWGGKFAATYTVNDKAEAVRLFAMGVDAIFTDRLDLFEIDMKPGK